LQELQTWAKDIRKSKKYLSLQSELVGHGSHCPFLHSCTRKNGYPDTRQFISEPVLYYIVKELPFPPDIGSLVKSTISTARHITQDPIKKELA